jgi:hypothetical protein
MSNCLSVAVTNFQLPVTNFQLPQIIAFAAHLPALAPKPQCRGIYALIDVCRVTEVTNFVVNREVHDESLQINTAPSILYTFLKISLSRRKLVTSVTVLILGHFE